MDYLVNGTNTKLMSICPMSGGECTCYAGGKYCSTYCKILCKSRCSKKSK